MPPPRDDLQFSNTTGILLKKKKPLWFIGIEVEQETSAPPNKTIPGSAPVTNSKNWKERETKNNYNLILSNASLA